MTRTQACPGCAYQIPLFQHEKITAGHVDVCLECGQPLVFVEPDRFFALSTEDMAELARTEPEKAQKIESVQRMVEIKRRTRELERFREAFGREFRLE